MKKEVMALLFVVMFILLYIGVHTENMVIGASGLLLMLINIVTNIVIKNKS